ncbi:MAG: hypothetical protein GX444_04870 [Myxococcales bacterium]|nr:hypothetical protein [Myxococcales bacterium]
MKRSLIILALFALALLTAMPAFAVDIQAVQAAIRASGARWTAGETSVSHLSAAEMAEIANLPLESPEIEGEYISEYPGPKKADVPRHLDWRDKDGKNFITGIKDQHPCGSCATFSTVGLVESWMKLLNDNEFIEPDLAEQIVWSCAGKVMPPATFFHTLTWLKKSGTADEACYPYQQSQCDDSSLGRMPCDDRCSDWQQRVTKIGDYRFYMWPKPDAYVQELQNGPIVAGFMVFEDFEAYTGGIYEHTYGSMLGGHAIQIVGYDLDEEYWICKNSWGEDWGENGFFRAKFDSGFLGFGYQGAAITATYDTICGQDQAPEIANLQLTAASLPENGDLEISFGYSDHEANLAGGELFYAVDEGDATRYVDPLLDLTGTVSKAPATFTLAGPFAPGEHTLTVYVADLCGVASNELNATFTVAGEIDDDSADDDAADDDAAGDDDGAGDDEATGDDDDDDNGGCGA